MKRILNIFVIVSAVAALSSCHGDLNIVQKGALTASNMWQSSTQVELSTNEIYNKMRTAFVQNERNVLHWGELRVGEGMWTYSHFYKVYVSHDVLTNKMTSSSTSASWADLYKVIDQANAVLKYAASESIEMEDAKRSWALGQAAFARAFSYFWAARIWGDVPLNLVPVESVTQPECYPFRAPKAEVYAQIGKDIEKAIENIANLGTNKYLATADAVYMLKAEYALWMATNQGGDKSVYLPMAEDALNALGVKAGDSRFLAKYSDIFDGYGDASRKNSKEILFALCNNQTEKLTGGFTTYFTFSSPVVKPEFQNNPVPIGGTQWLCYSKQFIQTLNDSKSKNGDTRVDVILGQGIYSTDEALDGGELTWPAKFIGDLSAGTMIRDADLPYYRYGLAVMMMAELKYYQGKYSEANTYLNMIAKRAYGNDKFYNTATKEAVLEAITKEYFMEFPSEGVIWWALIRLDKIWDYNADLKARKNDTNILLWPITKSARNLNSNLTQTEGWY